MGGSVLVKLLKETRREVGGLLENSSKVEDGSPGETPEAETSNKVADVDETRGGTV